MEITLTVTFDGSVLKPEKPLNLELNKCYVITILPEEPAIGNVWDLLENLAGTVDASADWSVEHNHYLYGTLKHQSNENSLWLGMFAEDSETMTAICNEAFKNRKSFV